MRLDCDGDTVLLVVDQSGPACHTGDRTCFDADLLLAEALSRPARGDGGAAARPRAGLPGHLRRRAQGRDFGAGLVPASTRCRWPPGAMRPRERGNPRRLASVAAMAVGGALTHAVLARATAALALDMRAWTSPR